MTIGGAKMSMLERFLNEIETYRVKRGDYTWCFEFNNGKIIVQDDEYLYSGKHYVFDEIKHYINYKEEGDFYVFEDVDIYYQVDFDEEEIDFFSIGEPSLPDLKEADAQ